MGDRADGAGTEIIVTAGVMARRVGRAEHHKECGRQHSQQPEYAGAQGRLR
jgi:hypothetical protein